MEKTFLKKIAIWIWFTLWLFVKICMVLFILLVTYLIYSIIMMNPNLKKTEQIWNWIVNNIELYKEEQWEYPKKIEDLIPKYYDKIPKSKSGLWKFLYSLDEEKNIYRLSSTFGMKWTYSYYSDLKLWSKRYKNDLINEKGKVIQKIPIDSWYIKIITIPETDIVYITYDDRYIIILKEFIIKDPSNLSIRSWDIKELGNNWVIKYYIQTSYWLILLNKYSKDFIVRPFWYFESSEDGKYIISLSDSWLNLEVVDWVLVRKLISKEMKDKLEKDDIKFNWNILEYTTFDRVKHSIDLSEFK